MATQKDVARLSGVSVTTVSRVLNDSVLVNKKTKRIVQSAIKQLNYKPNLVAYGLRVKSSRLIGLILPDFRNSWYATFAQYVEAYCMENDYNIIIGLHRNDPEREKRLIDEFQRRNIDGLIIQPVEDEEKTASVLHSCTTVPVVLCGYSFANGFLSNVHFNNYRAGEVAAEYFLNLGHRRVACTVGPMTMQYLRERLYGFRERLAREGIELQPRDIFECNFNYQMLSGEGGKLAVEALVDGRSAEERPTAIWAHSDLTAVSIMRELHLRGIRIPEDISVIGVDNICMTDIVYPTLTTISQDLSRMSMISAKMLIQAIEQKDAYAVKNVQIEPELVIRESTCACRN